MLLMYNNMKWQYSISFWLIVLHEQKKKTNSKNNFTISIIIFIIDLIECRQSLKGKKLLEIVIWEARIVLPREKIGFGATEKKIIEEKTDDVDGDGWKTCVRAYVYMRASKAGGAPTEIHWTTMIIIIAPYTMPRIQ